MQVSLYRRETKLFLIFFEKSILTDIRWQCVMLYYAQNEKFG